MYIGRGGDRGLDDDEAVSRARTGDQDAYAVLVVRHSAAAHRAAALFGAGDDAADVVQDAFVKAYRSLDSFRDGAPFRPWLMRIVINETKNVVRGRTRRLALHRRSAAMPDVTVVADPADEAVATERRGALLRAVQQLREDERAVVVCRYLLELGERETADALGVPVGTVKSRAARALVRMRGQLSPALEVPRA